MKQCTERWWLAVLGMVLFCYLVLGNSGAALAVSPQIAAGSVNSVALKDDGTVWAWGNNELGQLGNGSAPQSPIPLQVQGLADIRAIAAGATFTVAVKADGTVWAWGDNRYGQMGNMDAPVSTPVQVNGLPAITAISAGDTHILALAENGTVWAWGNNTAGQLGDGTTTASSTPVQIGELTDIKAIAAGKAHSLAITSSDTLLAWGDNTHGQLGTDTVVGISATPVPVGTLTGISAIVAGSTHSLALGSNGSVWAWGSNSYGQLGNESVAVSSNLPVPVTGLSGITLLAAGGKSNLVIGTGGTVWAWGDNNYGQLGDGTTTMRTLPTAVEGLTGIKSAAVGASHSLVMQQDATIKAWGNNYDGQLGDGSTSRRTSPVQATGLTGVTALSTGFSHTVVRKNDGSVWSWGDNRSGQLGNGALTRGYEPIPVTGIADVSAVSAGDFFTLALKSNGTVWAWGDNWAGQLGNGGTTPCTTPGPVSDLVDVTAIAAGGDHAVALTSDGIVWTWGNNSYGQLGDSTTTSSATPFLVYDLETVYLQTVTAIAAGDSFSLALKADGTVWAWGNNEAGQLGDGTVSNRNFPVKVEGLTNITAIAAGGYHALAIRADGTLWAWGYNYAGQLGNGTTASSPIPVQITTLSNVTAIAAGFLHSLALSSDGTIHAWGYNEDGELGDGSLTSRTVPVPGGIAGAMAIGAGGYHSGAIGTDGTVWTWGWDGYGQLGDSYNTTLPVTSLIQLLTDRPTIDATPMILGFGSIQVGSTTTPQSILISNPGTGTLTISSITLDGTNPSQFSVTPGSCSSLTPSLAPGSSCTVQVAFTPTVVGNKYATLRITINAADNPSIDIPLSGTGFISYQTLTVTTLGPGSGRVDYPGDSCAGVCTSSLALNTPVQLIAVASTGSLLSSWSGCDNISDSICTVTMSEAKSVTATFMPDYGQDPPVMGLDQVSADFGVIATTASSDSRQVTISNSGTGILYVTSAVITGADKSQFSLQPGSCPSLTPTIAAGSSCTVYVTFAPSTIGVKSATLQVAGSDPVIPLLTVSLGGLAYDPPPVGSITINSNAAATTSSSVTLTLSAFDFNGTVAAMRFSNTNTSWSSWEIYGTSKDWTLTTMGGDGSKSVYVQFQDAAGNVSGSFVDSITLDTTLPVTTITTTPSPLTPAADGSISFTATETASFQCQMDAGTWVVCASPFTFSGLADGSHIFTVRATDPAGNSEIAPPSYSFTTDSTAPVTTIISQPLSITNATSGDFTFLASESNAIYQCQLDAGAWSHCYSSFGFNNLADGSHTFSVRAIDRAGNMDQTPATYSWTVDTIAPETAIVGAPGNSTMTNVTIAYTSGDPTATFACSLDGSSFSACTNQVSYLGLSPGNHTFQVRAVDPAGNYDATPATTGWTTGCNVQIVGGSCHVTIGEEIAAATDGATIQAKAMIFAEEIQGNYPKTLTFSGGFGANFEPPLPGAMTAVAGFTMNVGTMTVENLVIQ